MKNSTFVAGFVVSILIAAFFSQQLFAQQTEGIRHYLGLRDQLTEIKTLLEGSLSSEPGTGLLANPGAEGIIRSRLSQIDSEIQGIAGMTGPLAEYYADRLNRLSSDCRALFPLFIQRLALGTRAPAALVAPAVLSVPVAPVSSPGTSPGTLPGITAGTRPSTPADTWFGAMTNAPAVDSTAVQVVPPDPLAQTVRDQPGPVSAATAIQATPVMTAASAPRTSSAATTSSASPALSADIDFGAIRKRREFFHPIWFRTLLDPRLSKRRGKRPFKKPLRQAPPPELPPSLIPASAVAALPPLPAVISGKPASSPVMTFPRLPSPVDSFPAVMKPLEPWSGNDPQVRETSGMRPLAVMIENHNLARPQTAMDEAEVVYEIPVEGGITRFMALFYHVPGVIGPVRSCREYFLDRALEVNALYVHCGGSPKGYAYIGQQKAFAIDEISNGAPFFRDNTRKAPHNLYTRGKDLIDVMNRKFPMQLPYQRLPLIYGDHPTASTVSNRGVSIHYHGNYTAAFRFNPGYNLYDRFMNGTQQLDRKSLKPVSPGTVVVQEAAMRVVDEKGRQEISFIGQGRAFILYGGTITPVTWRKTAVREFTHFYDQRGNPVIFSSKAPVWIQVVSPQNPVVFDPPIPQFASAPAVGVAPAAAPIQASTSAATPISGVGPASGTSTASVDTVPPTHVPAPPEGQAQ